jgi:transcriptional regulator with XRE-family HTH domain
MGFMRSASTFTSLDGAMRLRELRRAGRLTQERLAVAAGVCTSTVYNAERGTQPRRAVQRALATVLGVAPDEIWTPPAGGRA